MDNFKISDAQQEKMINKFNNAKLIFFKLVQRFGYL